MRWTERQQAMLREMGLRVWAAPGDGLPEHIAATTAAQTSLTTEVSDQATAPSNADKAPDPAGTPPRSSPPQVVPVPVPAAHARPAAAVSTLAGPVATMDWPELRAAVAACTACSLCDSRTQTVFGIGHAQAHWMVVGEAPGEQEDLRGEPFVGAAGRLLDRMLLALGLTRGAADAVQQVYIANTLKCRPPRNRNPEPEELQRCQPFLERQVELVQPRVILAMGRFAVQSLLASTEPVGRLRGRVHQWRGRPLVVTYHPAYLLRNPADKARAWADLCLAAQVADEAAARANPMR